MCECYATIRKEDPRAEIWKQVTSDGTMPLKHPVLVKNKNFPKLLFYVGDADRLSQKQKDLMADLMSKKFKISRAEVLHNLATTGMFHIRSDNVSIVICQLHLSCMV